MVGRRRRRGGARSTSTLRKKLKLSEDFGEVDNLEATRAEDEPESSTDDQGGSVDALKTGKEEEHRRKWWVLPVDLRKLDEIADPRVMQRDTIQQQEDANAGREEEGTVGNGMCEVEVENADEVTPTEDGTQKLDDKEGNGSTEEGNKREQPGPLDTPQVEDQNGKNALVKMEQVPVQIPNPVPFYPLSSFPVCVTNYNFYGVGIGAPLPLPNYGAPPQVPGLLYNNFELSAQWGNWGGALGPYPNTQRGIMSAGQVNYSNQLACYYGDLKKKRKRNRKKKNNN